jgi:hypothetical protein
MKISDAYPSNYLKAADLQGRNILLKMDRVEIEKIGEDEKPVLFFVGKQKGVVLNKTNSTKIAAAYGDDTDDWRDQEIVLFPAMVDYKGETVEAIRCRAPQPKDRPQAVRAPARPDPISSGPSRAETSRDMVDDDIPF